MSPLPPPYVDPDPEQIWQAVVWAVGDCVTSNENGVWRRGVVETIATPTDLRGRHISPTLWIRLTDGSLVYTRAFLAERCSLLEVLADGAQ